MSYTIRQDQSEMEACRKFQTHADLIDIRMARGDFSISTSPDDSPEELDLNLSFDSQLRAEGKITRFLVGLSVVGTAPQAEAANEVVMRIGAMFLLSYQLKKGYSPSVEEINAFKEANAVFNCWPYFREFVQNCSSRMGIRVSPLPLLRLAPKPVRKADSAEAPSKS